MGHIKKSSNQAERSPGFETKELKIKGFGDFTEFAECMKKVMLEIEGIAHMPELDEKLKHYAGAEDQALWREQAKDENYEFSGFRNGLNPRSLSSRESNVRNLEVNHDYMASESIGVTRKYLRGGGSRYIQKNNDEYYTDACKQFLESAGLPDAYQVDGNDLPGSQRNNHTVNSADNVDHAGDGPDHLIMIWTTLSWVTTHLRLSNVPTESVSKHLDGFQNVRRTISNSIMLHVNDS